MDFESKIDEEYSEAKTDKDKNKHKSNNKPKSNLSNSSKSI